MHVGTVRRRQRCRDSYNLTSGLTCRIPVAQCVLALCTDTSQRKQALLRHLATHMEHIQKSYQGQGQIVYHTVWRWRTYSASDNVTLSKILKECEKSLLLLCSAADLNCHTGIWKLSGSNQSAWKNEQDTPAAMQDHLPERQFAEQVEAPPHRRPACGNTNLNCSISISAVCCIGFSLQCPPGKTTVPHLLDKVQ